MMRVWMALSLAATLLPLAVLVVWTLPVLAAAKRSRAAQGALAAAFLLATAFVLGRPHEDVFEGLDAAPYRTLSSIFWNGRGFHGQDTVLCQVPEPLRPAFLFAPVGRRTRDRLYQLTSLDEAQTQPFFLPTLPLAAGALSPWMSPDLFVPILAVVWWFLVLSGAYCAGGGWGVGVASALLLGSAWPAWFVRGFFAEAAGALLVASVVASAAMRRPRGAIVPVAGFVLGLAVTYHPTLLLVAAPVALGLVLESGRLRSGLALAAGGILGVFPLWAITRWVCQPYGDWTRLQALRRMVSTVPELGAVALSLGILALAGCFVLGILFRPATRVWLRKLDERLSPWGWAAIAVAPLLVVAVLPGSAGSAIRLGATSVWSGIRWPYGLLLLAGVASALRRSRPALERFWVLALAWTALFFLFVKGVEIPVGLWSHRRFVPVVLLALPLLAAPLTDALVRIGPSRRGWRVAAAMALLVAGGANLVRWPEAYVTANERGATAWVDNVARRIEGDQWTIFDYFPHAVPHMADLRHRVLGLGEKVHDRWPEVAAWLREVARDTEVRVVTSWTPCTLEEGARLEAVETIEGQFPVVRAKAFFPTAPGVRSVRNTFCRWMPLRAGETAPQDKVLDGSPLGLRGPWGPMRSARGPDGSDRPATWTRDGSGIVGPVPALGGRVVVRLRASSGRAVVQRVHVGVPWAAAPLVLDIGPELSEVVGVLDRSADGPGGEDSSPTCVYTLTCPVPYDPAKDGLRGYPPDLGIQLHRATLSVEDRR